MTDSKQALQQLLRRKNLKNTRSRQRIVDRIFAEEKHFTADDLQEDLKSSDQSVSKATVYRTLSVLVEAGLVQEHDFGTGHKVYEVATDKAHHDHLYCLSCGSIHEFYDPLEAKIISKIAKATDFEVRSHVLKIYGLCARCRAGGDHK